MLNYYLFTVATTWTTKHPDDKRKNMVFEQRDQVMAHTAAGAIREIAKRIYCESPTIDIADIHIKHVQLTYLDRNIFLRSDEVELHHFQERLLKEYRL